MIADKLKHDQWGQKKFLQQWVGRIWYNNFVRLKIPVKKFVWGKFLRFNMVNEFLLNIFNNFVPAKLVTANGIDPMEKW